MPGPGAKDAKAAKDLAKSHPQELRAAWRSDQARAGALALKPLAWAEDLHVKELEKIKTITKGSRSYRSHTNQSEDYQSL